ncbi:hypothetical protein [Xanthobacter autotrophicus]|uniref:hypothetical protein n=1 Tax=Xanthobacter autotrophicus TaxID=280 RepID=UPI0024ACCD4D|nr:hypothetical protein [Xanthobacter autotrophicus]
MGIEALDMRPAQQALRVQYGCLYYLSDACLRDVAALWGVMLPSPYMYDVGVFRNARSILHRTGRSEAEIRLACSPSGLWAMDTSYMLPLSGHGAAPSVWNPVAFLNEADAVAGGLHELIESLGRIASSSRSDASEALRLMDILKAERTPQLSLF